MISAFIISLAYLIWEALRISADVIKKWVGYSWWHRNVYLHSPHWKLVRRIKLRLSGHKCSVCGTTHRLDVHHKNYKHLWWEWLFLDDLQVLCRTHHRQEHGQ